MLECGVFDFEGGECDGLQVVQAKFITVISFWVICWNECSRVFTSKECIVFNNRLSEAYVVGNSMDNVFVEFLVYEIDCGFAIFAPSDKLTNHRIVVH